MSREILFRGKRLDNGEWVEGSSLGPSFNSNYYIVTYVIGNLKVCGEYGCPFDCDDLYEVTPTTVGQYTFLNDIDDKKIFTADILQDKITEELYVVDFIGGGFGLFTMKEYLDLKHRHTVILWDGLSEPQTACFVTQNLEVIGNIHDNPELVGEKSE